MNNSDREATYSFKHWFKKRKKSISQNNNISIKVSQKDTKLHNYLGFKLYFPNDTTIDVKKTVKNIAVCEKFIEQTSEHFCLAEIRKTRIVFVDLKIVSSSEVFNCEWPEFKTEIISNTEYCLTCFSLAVYQKVINDDNSEIDRDIRLIDARIINHQPILSLKNLKVNSLGTLVSIRGTVIKANRVGSRLYYKFVTFSCSVCLGQQIIHQPDGVFTVPSKCPTKGCRAQSNFTAHFNKSNRVDWQAITLQEVGGVDYGENRHVPRTVECELTKDLVGCCFPGDDVTITGIIKVQNSSDVKNRKNQPPVFLLYLDAISVVNNKNQSEISTNSLEQITFTTRDYYAIQKIHAEPNLFKFLVQSLCPNIYGNEVVKAGLLLALFGGTRNSKDDIITRSASHVLVVGDPGLGKSHMLQACTNVAPRGVYVCGNTSSSSGLTVMITKEASGDYSLEAGALLLANEGHCCIDEFDKMKNQHACLLEAMEQQSISIAKAGVTCSIAASGSILAAANPADGHYDKAKSVTENLKLSAPLISRFDLVFILLDQPCEKYDVLISEHVLALHLGLEKNTCFDTSTIVSNSSSPDTLANRLRLKEGDNIDPLPHPLFRKYIAYSQKYVHPFLSREARELLKQFYLTLRKNHRLSDCSPITKRQLESLLRLTQARAKLELREEATASDAADVIEIMQHSFIDAFTDEFGVLDFRRSQHGSGISKQSTVKKVLSVLQKRAEDAKKSIFSLVELQQIMEDVGLSKQNFYEVLEKLNFHGYILKKSAKFYQLTSVDYTE